MQTLQAPWTPLNADGTVKTNIVQIVNILRKTPDAPLSLRELNELGQGEWVAPGERWDMKAEGESLSAQLWPLFTAEGFTQSWLPTRTQYAGLFSTWGGAAACWDKLGFAAEEAGNGVDFGAHYSLAGDRSLNGDGDLGHPGIDSLDKLLHPETRYGGLQLISASGTDALKTEGDMIRWMARRAELPYGLWSLPFWQADAHRQPGAIRSGAEDALKLWIAKNHIEPGHYAVLGKAPHGPFQANNFADFGSELGITTEWIGPGVVPGWLPNSIAQLFDGLARGVFSYIEFEKRQGRNPLAV